MIRALWLARAQAPRPAARRDSTGRSTPDIPAARSPRSLRSQLKSRISALQPAEPARLREAFVETVLLWELGESLAPDPAFGEMVTSVSEQLASDAAVSERLHRALSRLAAEPR